MKVPSLSPEAVLTMVRQAHRQEGHSGQFHQEIADKLPAIHLMVSLEGNDPVKDLVSFVVEYIEMAPRLIECVAVCAREAGVERLFQPFVAAAMGYFTTPSVLLARFDGLNALLIKAYQCHRLMEEMYENNRTIRNSNLVEIEATQANLLSHHLIGEPFANELDQSLLVTVRQIAGSPEYYDLNLAPFVDEASDAAWVWMRHYWQTLLERNHIHFHLSHRAGL
ncbi:MAG: hypothetical protein EA349_05300 [Halomonadaceae bacterium]|nr:MAG: hypothetical protein EA349_05300 [Halomonadaceae bacterium]